MDKLSLISYKLVFNRKNRLKKNGTAPITIRCYQNGVQKHIPTSISIIKRVSLEDTNEAILIDQLKDLQANGFDF